MGELFSEDVTVPWGSSPDPLDINMGRWRMALYQDAAESIDRKFLYFLYDQAAEVEMSNSAKGPTGLVVFDIQRRFFVHSIPLFLEGRVKFCYTLKTPSPAGGSTLIVVTDSDKPIEQGSRSLLIWRIYLSYDNMNLSNEPVLISKPIPINDEFIASLREDAPELIVMTTPGFVVWRINCLGEYLSIPLERFEIGADLSHFYDAFVSQGNIYLLSSSPDGHFDPSRIHLISLSGMQRSITTRMSSGDSYNGFPEPRKQAAFGVTSGLLLMAGGEVSDHQTASCRRLSDYWFLDLTNFAWKKFSQQMPIALIEPRLFSGLDVVYLWGESDDPFPGIPYGTHVRIIRVKGVDKPNIPYAYNPTQANIAPPPYEMVSSPPMNPYGPGGDPTMYNVPPNQGALSTMPYGPGGNPTMYNVPPNQGAPSTMSYGSGSNPTMYNVPPNQGAPSTMQYGPGGDPTMYNAPPNQGAPSIMPYYPPDEKNKCCLQ